LSFGWSVEILSAYAGSHANRREAGVASDIGSGTPIRRGKPPCDRGQALLPGPIKRNAQRRRIVPASPLCSFSTDAIFVEPVPADSGRFQALVMVPPDHGFGDYWNFRTPP
jgi:hypothetical protein